MRIEAIRLKNFKSFKDLELHNIPSFCVLVGANGAIGPHLRLDGENCSTSFARFIEGVTRTANAALAGG